MRVLLLALFVFILAGFSLAITRFDMSGIQEAVFPTSSPDLTFEVEAKAVETANNVSVLRAKPEGVMLLSRALRAQTAHYVLPRDAGLISGELSLDIAVQISDEQHSLLRVFVGNQMRGEILLRPGQHDVSSDIGLTADDLAGDSVAVRFVLVTSEDEGACTSAGIHPSIVEIEQTSSVSLEVQSQRLTSRDQVAVMGNEVLIGWQKWLSEEQRHQRWTSAAALVQRGFDVRLVDAPDSMTMSGSVLKDLVTSDAVPFVLKEANIAWPEYIAAAGSNAGVRSFQQSVAWRHWYRIGPDDHLSNPSAFAYDLTLGPLPNDAKWTVIATHNGSIIDTRSVPGDIGQLERQISLEGLVIEPNNVIEITASSDYEPTGLCNKGPELFAELRPETRLIGGGADFEDGLSDVVQQLSQREVITVSLPENTALVEAQRMLDLTSELISEDQEMRLVSDDAIITGVRWDAFETVGKNEPENNSFVWFDEANRAVVRSIGVLKDSDMAQPKGTIALVVASDEGHRQTLLQPQ